MTSLSSTEALRSAFKRSTLPVVLNDDDRVATLTPRSDQLGDVRFRVGIVARSELGIVEASLHVDHNQRTLIGHASTVHRGETLTGEIVRSEIPLPPEVQERYVPDTVTGRRRWYLNLVKVGQLRGFAA